MNNNSKPVVVGIGEILWDMLPGGKRAGGAPINFVYHAAALGAEGVGKDVNMLIGNGYTKGHAKVALQILRENEKIRELFAKLYA